MRTHIVAAIAALVLATPLVAQAQDIPSYAQPAAVSQDDQVHGRIVSFDGHYSLQVRDERGFTDNVQLHDGTIINPTGLTLEPGMVVSIDGYNDGSFLAANEIDTPYTYDDGGVAYYDGYPWNHYGSDIGLGFFFGNDGWWHSDGHYRWNGGVRVYDVHHAEGRVGGGGGFHGNGGFLGGGGFHGDGGFHGGGDGGFHGGGGGGFHGGGGGGGGHH
jgi:hypothetical protein